MKIHVMPLVVAGIIGFAITSGLAIDWLIFLQTASNAESLVTEIITEETTCHGHRGGRHRRRSISYPCTQFEAIGDFKTTDGRTIATIFAAGSVRRGSLRGAYYNVGDHIPILYNQKDPSEYYIDDAQTIWGPTFMVGICSFIVFICGFAERESTRRL